MISAKEVRTQCIQKMGSDLGAVYFELRNEVAWLHEKWNQFLKLYGQSQESIEILNKAAGTFFGIIQKVLLEDIILHLSRLTDKKKSCGQKNLSLQILPEKITDPKLRAKIEELIEIAKKSCESARRWRDKLLAHRDYYYAITRSDSLPGIGRTQIESSLSAVRNILNQIQSHFEDGETGYEHTITDIDDAESLIYFLQKGIESEKVKKEQFFKRKTDSENSK
ncbi:MAG: hypothetical protein MUO31_09020 [Thermodesulfovibrionales bacterium]|nr:hypothetical protein [Thermodesulfovibrionales bacterium]